MYIRTLYETAPIGRSNDGRYIRGMRGWILLKEASLARCFLQGVGEELCTDWMDKRARTQRTSCGEGETLKNTMRRKKADLLPADKRPKSDSSFILSHPPLGCGDLFCSPLRNVSLVVWDGTTRCRALVKEPVARGHFFHSFFPFFTYPSSSLTFSHRPFPLIPHLTIYRSCGLCIK